MNLQGIAEKFDAAEKKIILGCVGAAMFLSYCLATDKTFFYKSLSAYSGDRELLASISSIDNDVKYSPSNLPVWEGGFEEQDLYRRDKIFTEEDSQATIKFLEGTEIAIDENSLVIIDQVADAPSVNLIKGKITTKVGNSNSSLKIFNNGEEIKVLGNGSDVQIEVNQGGQKITALNGKTLVESEEGLVELTNGQSLGDTVPSNPNSYNGTKSQRLADGRMQLAWDNPDQNMARLEISKDPQFGSTQLAEDTTADQYIFTPKKDGEYYWRLVNPDGTIASKTSQFEIRDNDGPSNLSVNNFENKVNGKLVRKTEFQWETTPFDQSGYVVEVSRNSSFPRRKTVRKISQSSEVIVSNLRPGTFYWRVRKNVKGSEWTTGETFVVNKPQNTISEQPNLKNRPKGLSSIVRGLYATNEAPTSALTRWRKSPLVSSYDIEVSTSPDFLGPPVMMQSTNASQIEVKNLKPGTYYWRVRNVFSNGEKGNWSTRVQFKVTDKSDYDRQQLKLLAKKAPETLNSNLGSPVVTGNQKTTASLNWKKKSAVEIKEKLGELNYEIEVDTDIDFRKARRFVTKEGLTRQELGDLTAGTYFWRVRTILPGGKRGDWSLINQFTIRKEQTAPAVAVIDNTTQAPPAVPTLPSPPPAAPKPKKVKIKAKKLTLEAPTILYPENKKVMDIKGQRLEWNKVENSKEYKLEVYSYDNPKKPILKKPLKFNSFDTLKLKPGKYFWRVASVSAEDISNYSKKKTFLVKDLDALKSLEPLKPDPNDRLTTSQIATVVEFEWLDDKRAAYYKIEASLSRNFLTTFFSTRVDEPRAKFNFPQGRFYWRLTAFNKKDQILKKGKINKFSVVATMGTPKFFGNPKLEFNVSKEQPRVDVKIAWSKIPSSDRYDVELASDADFSVTEFNNSQLETDINLTLEYGKYYARVRAVDSYGFGSPWSETKTIDVTGEEQGKAPRLVLPKDDANFVYRKDPLPISFRWKKPKQAVDFDFQVAKNENFTKLVYDERVTKTMLIKKLAEGEYYWRVKAIDDNDFETAWSQKRLITVKKVDSAVALTFPIDSKEVVKFGEAAALNFKWKAPKDISKFTIVIAKDENFTEIISRKTVSGKKIASLDLDHTGEAYWLVEGENIKENFKVRSDTGKFNIVSPSDTRFDRKGKVAFGVRPSQGAFASNSGTNSSSSMVEAALEGKYWINDTFGLGIGFSMGTESVSFDSGTAADYTYRSTGVHALVRTKILAKSKSNFDLLGFVGMRQYAVPLAESTGGVDFKLTPEMLNYLSLGIGVGKSFTETWSTEMQLFYESGITASDTLEANGGLVFLLSLQQRVLDTWQLSYSYRFNSISYLTSPNTASDEVEKTSNAVEISVGKGF